MKWPGIPLPWRFYLSFSRYWYQPEWSCINYNYLRPFWWELVDVLNMLLKRCLWIIFNFEMNLKYFICVYHRKEKKIMDFFDSAYGGIPPWISGVPEGVHPAGWRRENRRKSIDVGAEQVKRIISCSSWFWRVGIDAHHLPSKKQKRMQNSAE